MIGIRTGGVFSGKSDVDDMKTRIKKIILEMRESDNDPDMGSKDGDPSHCMSLELEAHKGSYVVTAGVFNYWSFGQASEFVKKLSDEFGTNVMHMGHGMKKKTRCSARCGSADNRLWRLMKILSATFCVGLYNKALQPTRKAVRLIKSLFA